MPKYLSFVLLGVLTLAGLGGVAVGIAQSSSATALGQAVTNTLKAPNYSEALSEKTTQGNQVADLVYQAPDRLGGTLTSAGRSTTLVIIGTTEYVSVTRAAKSTAPLTFYTQQSQGAQAVDPAHTYLAYWDCRGLKPCPTTRNGSVTTVTLSQGGQTETLTYTVTGNVVSKFTASTPGGTIELLISEVGSSPPVKLPAGARVVTVPSQPAG